MTQPTFLPPEIEFSESQSTAVRIKTHLLRAQLEMGPEESEEPLPLVHLMTLLAELAGHVAEMEGFLTPVWSAWRRTARAGGGGREEPADESLSVLPEMRATTLRGHAQRLRLALGRQRRAAQLCLVLQSALKAASSHFARELAAEFDPAAIAARLRAAHLPARPELLWKKYEEQADRMTPTELEQRLTRHLVAAIENLFQPNAPAAS